MSRRNAVPSKLSAFASKLRLLRKAHGLSQRILAADLQVSQQTVSCWKRGLRTPDRRTWVLLRHVFGYTQQELENSAPLPPMDSQVAAGPASRREIALPMIRKGTAAVRMDLADGLASEALDVPQAQRILREALRAKRPIWIILG